MIRKLADRRTLAHLLLLTSIVATIGCDQVTKHMAASSLAGTSGRSYLGGVVRMAYAENTGGFLGLGEGLPPRARTVIFTGATGLMLIGMVAFACRERLRGWPLLGATLFVAGGASNWVDRLANGRVVDFLNVGVGPVRTGIFNVADMALMLGGALMFVSEFRRLRQGSGAQGRQRGIRED
jgi:signal peptidase II